MAERLAWDKFETALLIEVFWCVERKEIVKSVACNSLSQRLRKIALKEGREIDELYRNYNGIIL